MHFSKETLAILKNFSAINPSILLKPGNFIMTKSINGVAYAEATIQDAIDEELGIYDLNSFLSILNQFGEDSEVDVDHKTSNLVISNNRAKVFCTNSDNTTIISPKQRLKLPVADLIFELKAEDLQDITKISRAVGADMIAITNREGRLVVDAFSSADSSACVTLYSLDIGEYDGTNNFRFVIALSNIRFILGDYKVLVSSKGAAKFEGLTATYVVVLETSSEHNF